MHAATVRVAAARQPDVSRGLRIRIWPIVAYPTRPDRSARANLAAQPAKGAGALCGILLGNHCSFQSLSLSAGATPDFLFTLRFAEGLLNSWPGDGGNIPAARRMMAGRGSSRGPLNAVGQQQEDRGIDSRDNLEIDYLLVWS